MEQREDVWKTVDGGALDEELNLGRSRTISYERVCPCRSCQSEAASQAQQLQHVLAQHPEWTQVGLLTVESVGDT